MKFWLTLICLLLLISTPGIGFAGPEEDYAEAYKIYLAAGASVAAYSGRLGELATHYLEQDGWQIDHYVQPKGHSGARFLIARKEGTPFYLMAIVGTENNNDIKTDIKVDKIYFAGNSTAAFIANANKPNIPDTEPKVHKGFNEFIQAGPSAVLQNSQHVLLSLPVLLTTDKNCKLFLTGHSLGGAAATLAGARLIDTGINPSQIEVITFGAPAIGNAAFAEKFKSTLHLTRLVNSGDIITGALQTLVGGYQQFGKEIVWTTPDSVSDPHKLIGYVDSAIKNYYTKRRLAIEAGVELPPPVTGKQIQSDLVYIVPLQNNLPVDLRSDFWYMNEALQDEYRQTLSNYILAASPTDSGTWRQAATAANCQWAIVSTVEASRVKQESNTYYITLTLTVYNVTTGTVDATATFSTETANLTPLEAFIHNFREIKAHLHSRFEPI
ncbi:MAG: lipase class 3 [Firmicutes bacterium]|nr:lipase class 3 [Bacillota bacterium]